MDDGVRQQFTSKERDEETGLDYFGARYYSHAHGRFTSVDPFPITKECFVNPQRLNGYAYVNNNPLAATDPSGGDGQGSGGDKVISVFLEFPVEQREFQDTRAGHIGEKVSYPKHTANWEDAKKNIGGYTLERYGPEGEGGLPQSPTNTVNAFNQALKNSEVVVHVGHGNGDSRVVPFVPDRGIIIGGNASGTQYGPMGRQSMVDLSKSGKPETNASVVLNFGCNTGRNSDFFNLTGSGPQYVIGVLAGNKSGMTSIPVLEKAAEAFVKAYSTTNGTLRERVDAGIKAAQKVISTSPDPSDRGGQVVIVREKR